MIFTFIHRRNGIVQHLLRICEKTVRIEAKGTKAARQSLDQMEMIDTKNAKEDLGEHRDQREFSRNPWYKSNWMEYPSQSDNDDEKRKDKGKEKRHYLDYGTLSTNYRDQRPSKSRRERFENKYVVSTMVVYFNVLAGDMTRGILFPTLWLYVASLGGSKSFQGIVVSAYSCGRILAAPLFGYLSEKFDHQSVMILCNLIIIMGTLIYSIGKVLWIIPLGNFFIGMGAASTGVTRSYVAETTPNSRRTEFIAYLTSLQYAGFTATPVIGAAIGAIFEHSTIYGINQYSAPAIFVALMCFISILLLMFIFENIEEEKSIWNYIYPLMQSRFHPIAGVTDDFEQEERTILVLDEERTEKVPSVLIQAEQDREETKYEKSVLHQLGNPSKNEEERKSPASLPVEEWRSSILMFGIFLNFVTKGTIGVFETITIIITDKFYHWDSVKTGTIISIFGLVGALILINFKLLLKCFKDYQLVTFGLIFMTISCFLLNNNYYWITFPLNDPLLVLSLIFMLAIGYPIAHSTLIGLFSRLLLAQEKQGRSLGFFSSIGSLARILFPLLSGIMMDYFHHFNVIFFMLGVLLLISVLAYMKFEPLLAKLLE